MENIPSYRKYLKRRGRLLERWQTADADANFMGMVNGNILQGNVPDFISPIDVLTNYDKLVSIEGSINKEDAAAAIDIAKREKFNQTYGALQENAAGYQDVVTDKHFIRDLKRYHNKQMGLLEKVKAKKRRQEARAIRRMVYAIPGIQHQETRDLLMEDFLAPQAYARLSLSKRAPINTATLNTIYDLATPK